MTTKIIPDKKYFRVDEVAEIFDMKPVTIYKMIARGKIKVADLSGSRSIRIPRDSVEKMVKGRQKHE
jgi:excisionase family DNA binding protein